MSKVDENDLEGYTFESNQYTPEQLTAMISEAGFTPEVVSDIREAAPVEPPAPEKPAEQVPVPDGEKPQGETPVVPETTEKPGEKQEANPVTEQPPNRSKGFHHWKDRARTKEAENATLRAELAERDRKLAELSKKDPPKLEDFNTVEEWADKRDEFKREQESVKAAPTPEQLQAQATKDRWEAIQAEGRDEFTDFDEVIATANPADVTPAMGHVLALSDDAHKLTYVLSKNQEECKRIAALTKPVATDTPQQQQAKVLLATREMDRLNERYFSNLEVKTPTDGSSTTVTPPAKPPAVPAAARPPVKPTVMTPTNGRGVSTPNYKDEAYLASLDNTKFQKLVDQGLI